MKKYRLFREWRERSLYGESLADAVMREKKLRRPDTFKDGVKIDGEEVKIKRVVEQQDTGSMMRGGAHFESVIIELEDGRLTDVDAVEIR